ncbi:metallophosphoesterase [Hirschia baltica]|uniref:Metallophosphoesterase n=1 Tax=Hirschia baltica (strain ATCC 49814 / DSM 5838 / IFAM 1418) TaxID=582402 RepID=C6XKY8_HIRBI|nr:metallophosphoesterase [Hirschia baltica]ACT57817.1 metallophosphoesterase [Hirschia baltica ATCC 49814]
MIFKLNNIRAIGDVHGHPETLEAAAGDADHIMLLGDLIDRGPDSAGALRLALDWIESGRAYLVRSNHDDKLYRMLKGNNIRMNKELSATVKGISNAPDGNELKERFVRIYADTPHILRMGKFVFAHGAVSPYHFEHPDEPISLSRLRRRIENMALYGEVRGERDEEGRPVRHYDWVEQLPEGVTAVVGHDIRAEQPFVHTAENGRRAIFLDTGCGKGGPLSYIDLPSEKVGQVPVS